MDIVRELQKVKTDMEQRHSSLTGQIRAEISRANSETRIVLNTLDERIEKTVQRHVQDAFSEIKNLLRMRQGAI